ncbi:MAG: head GIN domain-containing protein [Bacteroidota bacterium]
MTTLAKIIVTLVASLFFVSCNFDIQLGQGEQGNGNVVTEDRNTTETFTVVKASEGLDVYVTQGNTADITVEADENIIDLIRTDIKEGVLRIHTEKRIGRAKSKKIHVTLSDITKLTASSGADLESRGTLSADRLVLDSSSGADIIVTVNANEVECDASSGADIRVSGTAETLVADARQGSDVRAGALEVKKCIAEASSGADITVNASEELSASASSGGDVKYNGNPNIIKKNSSASGSVKKG